MKWINRSLFIGILLGFVIAVSMVSGAVMDRLGGMSFLNQWLSRVNLSSSQPVVQTRVILNEESVVIDIAENVSESVVTVGIKKTERFIQPGARLFDPFLDPFGLFFQQPQIGERKIERDIGSGFIVSSDGLIVTNKHVVADRNAEYVVFTKDNREFKVEKIERDPLNDLAILKISADGLKPVELGDSDKLKVGQFVVAIGTALGEFRHTVTTGVISGLGRGIVAGDAYRGSAEELSNVIQTDAAINPGNSGGPLVNSAKQVIGVNVAVVRGGENIGFALPINIVKDALENFQQRGGFGTRAFLGVRYMMISKQAALYNEVPQGAYVEEVVPGSAADQAGIRAGDIITKIDDESLNQDNPLAKVIAKKRAGDKVSLEWWSDGETKSAEVTLQAADE